MILVALVESAVAEPLELDYADPGVRARWGWGELQLQTFGNADLGYVSDPADGGMPMEAGFDESLFLTGSAFGRVHVLWEALVSPTVQYPALGISAPYVHRFWVSGTIVDALQVKVGTEHSPVSWWIRSIHHGAWLTPSISRPFLGRFEDDGLLQAHTRGAELFGHVPVGSGSLEYVLGVGQAEPFSRIGVPVEEEEGTATFQFDRPIWSGSLAWQGRGATMVRVGLAGSYAELPAGALAGDTPVDQGVATAHVVVHGGRLELTAEGGVVLDRPAGGTASYLSHTAYAQAAWQVGRVTPFLRADYEEMALGDPYYAEVVRGGGGNDGRDLDRWQGVGGVRVDVTRHLALKVEGAAGREERRDAAGQVGEVTVAAGRAELAWLF